MELIELTGDQEHSDGREVEEIRYGDGKIELHSTHLERVSPELNPATIYMPGISKLEEVVDQCIDRYNGEDSTFTSLEDIPSGNIREIRMGSVNGFYVYLGGYGAYIDDAYLETVKTVIQVVKQGYRGWWPEAEVERGE